MDQNIKRDLSQVNENDDQKSKSSRFTSSGKRSGEIYSEISVEKDQTIENLKVKLVQMVQSMKILTKLNLQQKSELEDVYESKSQLESIIEQQRRQIEKLNQENAEIAATEQNNQRKSATSVASKLPIKKEGISNLQLDLVKAYGEKANLRQENENLKQELEKQKSLQQDNMQQNQKMSELLQKVSLLKSQNEELDVQNHDLKLQVDQIKELNFKIQENNEDLEAAPQQNTDTRSSQASKNKITQNDNEKDQISEIQQLNSDNQSVVQKILTLQQIINPLNTKISELQNRNQELQEIQEQNNQELKQQTDVIQKLKSENKKLGNMIQDQHEKFGESQDNKREYDMQQIRFLEKEKEALKGQILKASSREQQLNLEGMELIQKNEDMQNQLQILKKEIIQMKKKFNDEVHQFQQQNEKLQGLANMHESLTQQVDNLQVKDKEAQTFIQSIMLKIQVTQEAKAQLIQEFDYERNNFQDKIELIKSQQNQNIKNENEKENENIQFRQQISEMEIILLEKDQAYQELLIKEQDELKRLTESLLMLQKFQGMISEQKEEKGIIQTKDQEHEYRMLQLKEENEALQQDLEEQKQQITDKEEEILQLLSNECVKANFTNELQSKVSNLQMQLDSKNNVNKENQSAMIFQLKNEKQTTIDKYDGLRQQLQNYLVENQEKEQKISHLEEQLNDMIDQNKKQKEQFRNLKIQLTDTQTQFQPMNESMIRVNELMDR